MTDPHAPVSEMPPSAGLVAGKYQLLGMIGRGGMGSVWEGRHATLGTRVAIKFIETEYASNEEARSRFDNEARAAATIQSKHAIQIFDHGITDDGKPYIVMEMLQGEPLDKRLERLGRISLQDTARIIQQVSRALSRAHDLGIIHRDLKPENIFLVKSPDDDDEIAKVLDFGIAKFRPGAGDMSASSSTKTGAVLGTPFYMSPEQARGLRNIDRRTDIWSLGVIAYKCTTGLLPFDGESVGDLLVKICVAPIPVPSQHVPGLPPTFDAWFMRALDRDTDRRFPTVSEMAEALAFAAGITLKRGGPAANAATMPLSSLPGSGPQGYPGAMTPHGMVQTPRPGSMPGHAMGRPATGSGPQPQYMGHAAASTSAPFTTSAPDGSPKGGSGKVIFASIGAAVLGLVVVAGVVVAMKMGDKNGTGAGSSEPPSAQTSLSATAAATSTAGSAATGTAAATGATAGTGTTAATGETTATAAATARPTATQLGVKTAAATATVPARPSAAPSAKVVQAATATATATTAPPQPTATATATTKKPSTTDPGY